MNLRHGLTVLQGMYVMQGVWGEECGQVCPNAVLNNWWMNLRHGLTVLLGMYVMQGVWGKSVGRGVPTLCCITVWMNLRHGLIVLQGMYVVQGVWGEECGQVCSNVVLYGGLDEFEACIYCTTGYVR